MEEKTKKNGGAVKWVFPVVILILVGVIAWLLLRPQEQPAGLTRAADAQLGQLEGKTDEQKEIARLKRELRDAQDALDVLKKAISILGK